MFVLLIEWSQKEIEDRFNFYTALTGTKKNDLICDIQSKLTQNHDYNIPAVLKQHFVPHLTLEYKMYQKY
ncbi:MAG: hypothetical protein LBQ50_12090 [Planctomycetaceae bacterium]|jgi:hypothetical protein|nr:hypothetical protein [Planctomycetaceae bacterium]